MRPNHLQIHLASTLAMGKSNLLIHGKKMDDPSSCSRKWKARVSSPLSMLCLGTFWGSLSAFSHYAGRLSKYPNQNLEREKENRWPQSSHPVKVKKIYIYIWWNQTKSATSLEHLWTSGFHLIHHMKCLLQTAFCFPRTLQPTAKTWVKEVLPYRNNSSMIVS